MLKVDLSSFTARQQLGTKLMRPTQRRPSVHDLAMRHRHSRKYTKDLEHGEFEPTEEVIEAMNLMPDFRGVRLQEFKRSAGNGSRPTWRHRSLERLPIEKREEIVRDAWRNANAVYQRAVKGNATEEEAPKPAASSQPAAQLSHDQLRKQCCTLQRCLDQVQKNNDILRMHLELMASARRKLELRERAARTRKSEVRDEPPSS
jgi:hypothetical protein